MHRMRIKMRQRALMVLIDTSRANRRLVAISNSMPLNHYAVDVVSDLVNCVPLEKMLRQESNAGTATVSTVAEMFDKTMEKTPQLKQMIVARAGGSNLEFVLKQFRMKLFSRKEPGDVTMMACLILAMDQFCTGLSHKVKTGVIKAASLVHSERMELISVVEDSGKLGPVPKEMKGMRLAELPGLIELFDGAVRKEFCSSFETLVMKYVCYEPDVPGKLRNAESRWSEFNGSKYSDCELLISDECNAFDVCTGWFDGNEVCSEYHSC